MRGAAVRSGSDVVNVKNIDPRQAKALKTVLETSA
jgi:hypothetical protein